MRKSFKLEDLGCANCAAKMQDKISALPGVEKASVNFMTQKFTLVADDDKFEDLVNKSQKIMTSYEKDCTIIR